MPKQLPTIKNQKLFSVMGKLCEEQGLIPIEKSHTEIYITDARRTAPEKLKTVLRFKVINRTM